MGWHPHLTDLFGVVLEDLVEVRLLLGEALFDLGVELVEQLLLLRLWPALGLGQVLRLQVLVLDSAGHHLACAVLPH